LNLEERLIRDADSFAAEVGDINKMSLIARVCRTLAMTEELATDDAPEADHPNQVVGPRRESRHGSRQ